MSTFKSDATVVDNSFRPCFFPAHARGRVKVHVYSVDKGTHQMHCICCGQNVIRLPLSDKAAQVGKDKVELNEVVCTGAIDMSGLR